MKKILILLAFIITSVSANNPTLKLYEKIFSSIIQESSIDVYTDKETQKIIRDSSLFHSVDDCYHKDVIVIGNFTQLPYRCEKNLIFATNYRSYKYNKNAFGAYYWKKGRPQLIFNENVLTEFHLQLPQSFKKYGVK